MFKHGLERLGWQRSAQVEQLGCDKFEDSNIKTAAQNIESRTTYDFRTCARRIPWASSCDEHQAETLGCPFGICNPLLPLEHVHRLSETKRKKEINSYFCLSIARPLPSPTLSRKNVWADINWQAERKNICSTLLLLENKNRQGRFLLFLDIDVAISTTERLSFQNPSFLGGQRPFFPRRFLLFTFADTNCEWFLTMNEHKWHRDYGPI